jgi:hypothetical protein
MASWFGRGDLVMMIAGQEKHFVASSADFPDDLALLIVGTSNVSPSSAP